MVSFDNHIAYLRSVAEPSRLRLLLILSRGEFSVTELTQVLGQSQPRVSRHLKLLCDVGLLEKFREQHWIYYHVPADGAGRDFVDYVIAGINPADPALEADGLRVEAVLQERGLAGHGFDDSDSTEAGPVELIAALAEELGNQGRAALFYFGRSPADVLGAMAARARRLVGMHASRREVQRARALLHSRGLSHCALQQGELLNVPQPSGEFDTAVLDRALADQPKPVDALREAARLLNASGELIVAESYEALAGRVPGANPLVTLKAWLVQAGLVCTRLHPLDLDGEHLVLAVANTGGAVSAAA